MARTLPVSILRTIDPDWQLPPRLDIIQFTPTMETLERSFAFRCQLRITRALARAGMN